MDRARKQDLNAGFPSGVEWLWASFPSWAEIIDNVTDAEVRWGLQAACEPASKSPQSDQAERRETQLSLFSGLLTAFLWPGILSASCFPPSLLKAPPP